MSYCVVGCCQWSMIWMLMYQSIPSTWCVERRSEELVDVWRIKEFPAVKVLDGKAC